MKKKKHDIGLIVAIVFAVAVIIYVMASGGVHAEKADEVRMEKEYDYTESNTAVHDSTDYSNGYHSASERREERFTGENSETDDTDSNSSDSLSEPVADSEFADDVGVLNIEGMMNDEQMDGNDYIDNSNRDDSGVNSTGIDNDLDVWDMGLEWYGISYEDTNRTLRLITYEGYKNSMLSYYVACCCWVRATEGYWGYGNLYSAFGEIDTQYGLWMDSLEIADWAYYYLEMCYQNPTYCKYVNGLMVPSDYIYCERGIYCWN